MFKLFLGLCAECSNKLNYKHKKNEVKRKVSKLEKGKSKRSRDEETPSRLATTSVQDEELPVNTKLGVEDNVWSEQLQIEDEKPREDDFEDYLEQLLL